jgi:hypothetical protein
MSRGPAKKKTEDTSSLESKLWATAAKQTDIGKRIDDAMTEIEKENPKLKASCPRLCPSYRWISVVWANWWTSSARLA